MCNFCYSVGWAVFVSARSLVEALISNPNEHNGNVDSTWKQIENDSDRARLVLQPPRDGCQRGSWFRLREQLRMNYLTPGLTWNNVELAFGRNAGDGISLDWIGGIYETNGRDCDAAVTALKLQRAIATVKVAVQANEIQDWFRDHNDLLSQKLSWRLILEPFPLSSLLSTIHRYLLPAMAPESPCSSAVEPGWQGQLNLNNAILQSGWPGTNGYHSMGEQQIIDLALDFLMGAANCDLGRSVSYALLILGNRTARPWTATLLDRIDADVSWADVLNSSWPVFHVLRALESKWFFSRCPSGSQAIWSTTDPAFLICVPSQPGWVSSAMLHYGKWDDCDDVVRWLPQPSFTCELVVEVGASFGVCTLLIAKLGFRIVAVDAQKRHIDLLRASVALNGLEQRVSVIHAAVANKSGNAHLVVTADSSLAQLRPAIAGEAVEAVRVRTIDDIVRDKGLVCALKTDCEGADVIALQGAASVIKTAEVIYFEDNAAARAAVAPDTNVTEMIGHLRVNGFDVDLAKDNNYVAVRRHPPS